VGSPIPTPRLTGFEIVVASSNNAAVENISKELPASSAVGPEWQAADYFAQQATAVLGEPAWGLIAAALGNGANRAEFRANFWYGRSGSQDDSGDGSHGNRDGRKAGGSGVIGFMLVLLGARAAFAVSHVTTPHDVKVKPHRIVS
jgi:hypothetical protein